MSDLIYKNIDALNPVENLVSEAKKAINDSSRIASDSEQMNEALAAATGAGVGAAGSYAALYFAGTTGLSAAGISSGLAAAGGLVGGGMAAGVAVLAAPAAVLGIAGYALMSKRNSKKLIEKKELLLQEVMRSQHSVIQSMKEQLVKNQERADYLSNLNTLLKSAIRDLQQDLRASK